MGLPQILIEINRPHNPSSPLEIKCQINGVIQSEHEGFRSRSSMFIAQGGHLSSSRKE